MCSDRESIAGLLFDDSDRTCPCHYFVGGCRLFDSGCMLHKEIIHNSDVIPPRLPWPHIAHRQWKVLILSARSVIEQMRSLVLLTEFPRSSGHITPDSNVNAGIRVEHVLKKLDQLPSQGL